MNILTYPTLDSTNDEAKRLLAAGQLESGSSTLILADTQTAGRGTRGRHWQSPTGGLYMTLVHTTASENPDYWLNRLHPPASVALTLAAGIACQHVLNDVIEAATGYRPVVLKPINDLMIALPSKNTVIASERSERGNPDQDLKSVAGLLRDARNDEFTAKLGGILVETQLSPTGKLSTIITGVGVNLTTAPEADYLTASLAQVMDAETLPTRHALAERLAGSISSWYEACSQ